MLIITLIWLQSDTRWNVYEARSNFGELHNAVHLPYHSDPQEHRLSLKFFDNPGNPSNFKSKLRIQTAL